MIIQATDLGIEIDTGTNESGAVMQRLEDGEWRDYLRNGKRLRWPVAVWRVDSAKRICEEGLRQ
jgi:hypothetical protein